MIELTKEQIEKAAELVYLAPRKVLGGGQWENVLHDVKSAYLKAVIDAAPYLQSPWEMPTLAEANRVHDDLHTMSTCDALSLFVNRRNASLVPPLEDPRREKIKLIIRSDGRHALLGGEQCERVTDAILKALDEDKNGN